MMVGDCTVHRTNIACRGHGQSVWNVMCGQQVSAGWETNPFQEIVVSSLKIYQSWKKKRTIPDTFNLQLQKKWPKRKPTVVSCSWMDTQDWLIAWSIDGFPLFLSLFCLLNLKHVWRVPSYPWTKVVYESTIYSTSCSLDTYPLTHILHRIVYPFAWNMFP